MLSLRYFIPERQNTSDINNNWINHSSAESIKTCLFFLFLLMMFKSKNLIFNFLVSNSIHRWINAQQVSSKTHFHQLGCRNYFSNISSINRIATVESALQPSGHIENALEIMKWKLWLNFKTNSEKLFAHIKALSINHISVTKLHLIALNSKLF